MTSKCSLKLKWTQELHASDFDAKFEHFQVTSIDNGKLSFSLVVRAPVVQMLDSTINGMNRYPVDTY